MDAVSSAEAHSRLDRRLQRAGSKGFAPIGTASSIGNLYTKKPGR